MPEPVETSDPEGVDYGWVMQTTFVLTIVIGAPLVAALSIPFTLPTWGSRLEFAIRVGAVVWILIAVPVLFYAKWWLDDSGTSSEDPSEPRPDESSADENQSGQ
ncbi:DUF5822 domain-containing protein [Natranaeroarchaeum sulfidigenes]|uniref:DUF5822 domain-containing protein n=1 Tax=Natranaeroarchaeum sulfidigenes TaxID=2784880 RepID=UPI001EE530B9|nr:DUF5822 domain-containing protein [Natranaeroarchaeum sulfidigenes]